MASAAGDILGFIAEIGGEDLARRTARACSGRRINMSAIALVRTGHPLRAVLGEGTTTRLIQRLGEMMPRRRIVRFPEAVESAYLRERRERTSLIRRLILDGQNTRTTARAAKVHSRTVVNHRARLRAEGLLTAGGDRG